MRPAARRLGRELGELADELRTGPLEGLTRRAAAARPGPTDGATHGAIAPDVKRTA